MLSVSPIQELYISIPSETKEVDKLPVSLEDVVRTGVIEQTIGEAVSGITFCSIMSQGLAGVNVGGVVAVAIRMVQKDSSGNVVSDVVYTHGGVLERYLNYKLDPLAVSELGVYLMMKAVANDISMSSRLRSSLYNSTNATGFVEVVRTVVYKLLASQQGGSVPVGTNLISLTPAPQLQNTGVAEVDVTVSVMIAVSGLTSSGSSAVPTAGSSAVSTADSSAVPTAGSSAVPVADSSAVPVADSSAKQTGSGKGA